MKWAELFGPSLHLNSTPLSVAGIFGKQVQAQARAWIFTSATLSVGGDFRHYRAELGLENARAKNWESPFDYARQALLYVPARMPEPNTPDYTRAVIDAAVPVIEASGGGAFVLFTSLRAMREGYALLQDAGSRRKWSFPLLMQGEGSRTELLERFRKLGNAVLIGSQSFWEGVDVKGEALSLVVIDKLPFSAPDDPVLAARIDKINQEGRNAFLEYQLPEAVITLKQGAGRLIRDETDRGVLMICDPRLYSKSYGRRILQSLPPMRRTRIEADAVAFFHVSGERRYIRVIDFIASEDPFTARLVVERVENALTQIQAHPKISRLTGAQGRRTFRYRTPGTSSTIARPKARSASCAGIAASRKVPRVIPQAMKTPTTRATAGANFAEPATRCAPPDRG